MSNITQTSPDEGLQKQKKSVFGQIIFGIRWLLVKMFVHREVLMFFFKAASTVIKLIKDISNLF